MKKGLLIACALMLSTLGIKAQWTAPELPLTTDHIPSAALFYHVGQGMFLYPGTTYDTHAALTDDVTEAYLYEIQAQEDEENVYKFYSAVQGDYLGRSSIVEIYVDTNSREWGITWEFYKDETTGYYHIRNAASDPVYGADLYGEDETNYGLYEMGWDPTNIDLDKSGGSLGTNVGIFMLEPLATDMNYQLEWAFVDGDDYELYAARYSLYSSLMEGIEIGMSESDLNAYAALLESTDIDAINEAKETVDQLVLDFSLNTASPENPQDVTGLISNPTMEGTRGEEPEGDWIDTYGNMLIQNNATYFLWDDELGELTSEYGLNNFSQNWRGETDVPIEASDIHQVIADLPQGRYYLVADCIATTGSSTNPVSGAALYATSNGITYSTAVCDGFTTSSSGNSYPRRYYVDVIHFGGDLTIGYGYTPGWVRWFAVDNFQLYYCGGIDNAGAEALMSAINNAQTYVDEYGDTYVYSQDTYETLVAEIANANGIASAADDNECQAEAAVLGEIVSTVQTEISAYASLLSLCEQVYSDMTTYDTSLPELSEELSDMYTEYMGAYEDKSATVEQIEAWVEAYEDYVADYVKEAMKEATEDNPIEITLLATNMDYSSNSTDGWEVTTGSLSVSYHTAEVYNSAFTCLQTLDNMPAGQYTLKGKAFYRTASNADNYTAFEEGTDEILTFLVLENSKAPVINQAAGAQNADEAPYTGYTEVVTGVWVPNTMQSAEYAFNLDNTYDCEVSGYLMEDGTLTFGLRNDGPVLSTAWSIWTQLQLFYSGESTNAALDELQALVSEAEALDDEAYIIEAADKMLLDAIDNAYDLIDNPSAATSDAIIAASDALNEAIAYANEGLALISTLEETVVIYEDKMGEVDSSDNTFPSLLEGILDALGGDGFESNEQIQEWMDELAPAWTAFVQYDCLETASLEDPADITAVILNPSFDEGTNNTEGATGWTFSCETSGGHFGWNTTAQQEASDYAFEFWHVTVFEMSQTIQGLAEGYYHITANALYRAGNNSNDLAAAYYEDPEGARDVQLFGNKNGVQVTSVYDCALADATGLGGEVSYTYDGATYYVPNTMESAGGYFSMDLYLNEIDVYVAEGENLTIGLVLNGNVVDYNWCVWDNFTIAYLGNDEAPTAVESITAEEEATSLAGAAGIYDLSGRRVAKAQKGVYLIDGKKVLVK